jgi:hypothetical protein
MGRPFIKMAKPHHHSTGTHSISNDICPTFCYKEKMPKNAIIDEKIWSVGGMMMLAEFTVRIYFHKPKKQ